MLVYGKGDLEGDHLSSSEDINFASPKLEQLCSVHCTEDETDSRSGISTPFGVYILLYIKKSYFPSPLLFPPAPILVLHDVIIPPFSISNVIGI